MWNHTMEEGQWVEVTRDDGSVIVTRTRSSAHLLGGHTAVIWLEGISGAHALYRCKPAKESLAPKE